MHGRESVGKWRKRSRKEREAGVCSYLEAPGSEGPQEDDLLGGLADVDEASAAWHAAWPKVGNIHVPNSIHL